MSDGTLEIFEVGRCKIRIVLDGDPINPRKDFDHAGKMVCWHKEYDLGDEQSSEAPNEYLMGLVPSKAFAPMDARERRLDRKFLGYGDTRNRRLDDRSIEIIRERIEEARKKAANQWLDENMTILDLYLYDHGGITMSTRTFSCPWDSGQVGFIYLSLKGAADNWSCPKDWNHIVYPVDSSPDWVSEELRGKTLREMTIQLLNSEVKEYDAYLTGMVVGYVVTGAYGKEESCRGFYDRDYCRKEATDVAEKMTEEIIAEDTELEYWEARGVETVRNFIL